MKAAAPQLRIPDAFLTVHRFYLSKRHDVMLNMRPPHRLRVFVIICYHYGEGGIVFPYACDKIFQFVIAQEGLCGDGDKRTYVELYGNTQTHT